MTTTHEEEVQGEGEGLFEAGGRVLCVDEGCIGLVGPDGRCKVCGLPGPAGAGEGPAPTGGETWNAEAAPGEAAAAEEAAAEETAGPADEDFAARRLCRDESCIGVVGPDGRCRVCGLAMEPS